MLSNQGIRTKHTNIKEVEIERDEWDRADIAGIILNFENVNQSQREFSRENNIPHSTLQHWLSRRESIDADPFLVNFFENPIGMAFLHRLITAVHLVFTKDGVASIHNISTFLDLSGLSAFVGSSYSSQERASKEMDDLIIEYEESVKPELAKNMPSKKITLAEDETFHPEICVVSMEPVSNYIIVEKYVDNRTGKTWDDVVLGEVKDLPVEVIQVTSDEGSGLINHAINGLNAHHSSDCFHVQHEIVKGTSGALASSVKKAEKHYLSMVKETQDEIDIKNAYDNKPKPGRRVDFEKRIEFAENKENQAKLNWGIAIQNQETVRIANKGIGEIYHPYNLETGGKQDSQKVSELLESRFENIRKATMKLSERCKQRIEKAYRVVPNMVATIAFFFKMIDIFTDNMKISDIDKELMHNYLIPGFYLQLVAQKEKNTEKRSKILEISQELLTIVTIRDGPFSEYSESDIEKLEKAAKECAQIFQRSSSCVEGRNAQLSLRHHGIHKLSERCLKAQTIIHNYYRKHKDGTTPAERFFEAKHPDLFEWLLEKMYYPVRPRKALTEAA